MSSLLVQQAQAHSLKPEVRGQLVAPQPQGPRETTKPHSTCAEGSEREMLPETGAGMLGKEEIEVCLNVKTKEHSVPTLGRRRIPTRQPSGV